MLTEIDAEASKELYKHSLQEFVAGKQINIDAPFVKRVVHDTIGSWRSVAREDCLKAGIDPADYDAPENYSEAYDRLSDQSTEEFHNTPYYGAIDALYNFNTLMTRRPDVLAASEDTDISEQTMEALKRETSQELDEIRADISEAVDGLTDTLLADIDYLKSLSITEEELAEYVDDFPTYEAILRGDILQKFVNNTLLERGPLSMADDENLAHYRVKEHFAKERERLLDDVMIIGHMLELTMRKLYIKGKDAWAAVEVAESKKRR